MIAVAPETSGSWPRSPISGIPEVVNHRNMLASETSPNVMGYQARHILAANYVLSVYAKWLSPFSRGAVSSAAD